MLGTPQTSSGQNANLESKIKEQKQEIKRLKDSLNKEKADRLKFEKEKNEALASASKNAQELKKNKTTTE
ncbi:MAG: hypothetical protein LBU56_05260 [Rickettsiales bacterium]|nr:hypothetical protein [Rickettsiales bacterium]